MSENPVNSKSSDMSSSSSSSTSDAVVNWDRIIHKNVRTLDNQGMGKVIAIPNNEEAIIISSQSGSQQYKIPRSSVRGFDGAEVLLNETADRISSLYQVDGAYAYEAKPSKIIAEEHHQIKEATTVPLIDERLKVSKETITSHYFTVTKEPTSEKKTIEVPVTHEELIIEKKPAKDSSSPSDQGPVQSKKEIKVPLKREEVEIRKEPFVKEEVVVKKKPITETETISETVTEERINMQDNSADQNQQSTANTQR